MTYDRPMPDAPPPPPKTSRNPLPDRRHALRWEASIGDVEVHITVGLYAGGSVGELFVDVGKAGDHGWINVWARTFSRALQHGVPLEELVDIGIFTRFEPAGPVQGGHRVANCTSIPDLVCRLLAVEFLGRDDLAHRDAPEAL